MIKSKKEFKKFVQEEIYKATGIKANVKYRGVQKSLVSQYEFYFFEFEINCPSLDCSLYNDRISFQMNGAKNDYFEEGFTLTKEAILKKLHHTIVEIKEVLSEC